MTSLDSILKHRDISANKGPSSQSYGFSSCESWTINKAECWSIDVFKLWCWRRLESPLDKEIKPVNPKGNQPWIFTGRTDAEAKTPILWPPDVKSYSMEKTLMLENIEDKRRSGWQRIRWLNSIIDSMDMNLSKLRKILKDSKAWHAAVHEAAESDTI